MFKISNLGSYIKNILFLTIGSTVIAFLMVKATQKTPPPVPKPEPIVIQWEMDKEFGEKFTTLKNGFTLAIAHDDKKKDSAYSWSVSGESLSEKEATEMLFKLGGVK